MQHERRSGQRHVIHLVVEMGLTGESRRPCRAHNLTPEGMLLENCCGMVTIGTSIDLQIGWQERCWNIPATITHCNSICIGVMFNQRQSELYRTVTQTGVNISRFDIDHQPSAPHQS